MPEGIVKWFNPKKGFGFITSEDGSDIFVHKSGVGYIGSRSYLEEDLQVKFEVEVTPKGKRAINVRTELIYFLSLIFRPPKSPQNPTFLSQMSDKDIFCFKRTVAIP